MKRKLGLAAALLAAGILAAGCGDSSAAAPSSAQSAETTTSASETSASALDTTAAQTDAEQTKDTTAAAVTEKTQETSTAAQEIQPDVTETAGTVPPPENKTDTGLMKALCDRLAVTTDAISISYRMEEDGEILEGSQLAYGECFYSEMKAPRYQLTVCSDGKKTWMIHAASKTYAEMTGENAEHMKPDLAVPEMDELGSMTGSGKESFLGATRRYEEYTDAEDSDSTVPQRIRFYFDDQGNLVGYRDVTTAKTGAECMFEIKTVKSPDTKKFSPPAGYTEIEQKAMTDQVLAEMFGSDIDGTD